jgi:hypothetical protein
MDRHRMDHIGGDRIWERAEAAAVSMGGESCAETLAEVEMGRGEDKRKRRCLQR